MEKFISALEQEKEDHSGAKKIRKKLKELFKNEKITKVHLIIIGIPLKKDNIVEKVEGCFHWAYVYKYCKSPCFVDESPGVDFTIFENSKEAINKIKEIFDEIEKFLYP